MVDRNCFIKVTELSILSFSVNSVKFYLNNKIQMKLCRPLVFKGTVYQIYGDFVVSSSEITTS